MKHLVSQTLHAYWDDLRGGRTAPERADVDPAAIRHILAYTFILEVGAGRARRRDVRFRLSGTRLNALFGRDLRGAALDDILAPGHAPMADVLLDGVLDDRAAIVATARGGPPGWDPVDLELLLLPLRHHGRTHARVLGSLAAAEHPGWMGLRATAPLAILGFQAAPPRTRLASGVAPPAAIAPSPTRDVGSPGPEAAPLRRPSPRMARFRVVEGGRSDAAPGPF